MYRFRTLDTQNLASRSIEELTAMLSVAYGDLAYAEDHSLDRIRIIISIREITAEIARRTWIPALDAGLKPPTPGQ